MEVIHCKRSQDLVQEADRWCHEKLGQRSASVSQRIYVPAGETPRPLYRHWREHRPRYLNSAELLQIDDVITGSQAGLFRRFFESELGKDFRKQLRAIENADQQADFAILGFGLNGHLAFHEPEIGSDFFSGCVPLSKTTCSTLGLEAGAWGVTYGLAAFLRCRSILLMVSGEKKAAMFRRFLSEPVLSIPGFTALGLKAHPDLTVVTTLGLSHQV